MRLVPLLLAVFVAAGCGDDAQTPDRTSDKPRGSATGTGYSFDPPKGWKDITAELDASEIEVDTAYGGPVGRRVRPNVNVIRLASDDDPSLEDVERDTRAKIQEITGTELTATERVEVDGEAGVSFDYATGSEAAPGSYQRLVTTVRDGVVYTIAFTGSRKGFAQQVRRLDAMLASWRWEDRGR